MRAAADLESYQLPVEVREGEVLLQLGPIETTKTADGLQLIRVPLLTGSGGNGAAGFLTASSPEGTNLTLPSVVGYERRQLIYFAQLWNAFAAARMHHSCLWLLCRTLDVLVVRHEDRTGGG